jgi:hypothetical protein
MSALARRYRQTGPLGIWLPEAPPIPDLMRLLPGGQNGLGERPD